MEPIAGDSKLKIGIYRVCELLGYVVIKAALKVCLLLKKDLILAIFNS